MRPLAVAGALWRLLSFMLFLFSDNLFGVVLHLDLLWRDYALNHSVLINDKGGAEGAHVGAAVHLLLAPHAKLLDESLLRVGNEVERQFVLCYELKMLLAVVHACANHLVAEFLQLCVVVAQVARLGGASRRKVFRIEI